MWKGNSLFLKTCGLLDCYLYTRTGTSKRCLKKTTSAAPKQCLEEIGKLRDQRKNGKYPVGQCFLHRIFAYRGIVLFPWKAQLMDRDKKHETPEITTYYQALMDERDMPYVHTHPETSGFEIKGPGKWMFSIPGLDHVSQDDILPYEPTSARPVTHTSFDRYFTVRAIKDSQFKRVVPKQTLHEWRRKHIPWLYQTQVHRMSTEKVRITAVAFYLGRKRITYWWKYCIRIENIGSGTLSLQGQRWGIYIGNGKLKTVKDIGNLKKTPILTQECPAVQFSSLINLLSPRGHMWGYYLIQRQPGGSTFLCPVPSLTLESALARDPLKTINK